MIVLIHSIMSPYRISFFNAVAKSLNHRFLVLLVRETRSRRKWSIPWDRVKFQVEPLRSKGVELGEHSIDVSWGVRRALRRAAPDVVVVGGWDILASWVAVRWSRRHGVATCGWFESSATSGTRRGRASQAVRRLFLSMCDGVMVPGIEAEEFVTSLSPGIMCARMPNSVDAPELRSLAGPDPRKGGALFLGDLSVRKGFDIVLDAAPQLLECFPHLIVAGDGPLGREARATARHHKRMKLVGFVEGADRAGIMSETGVVLLPSRRDPWPLVACEALVARRPVVLGSGVSSARDLRLIAGDAVSVMKEPSAHCLVAEAHRAKDVVVPDGMRGQLTPAQMAKHFVRMCRMLSGASSL